MNFDEAIIAAKLDIARSKTRIKAHHIEIRRALIPLELEEYAEFDGEYLKSSAESLLKELEELSRLKDRLFKIEEEEHYFTKWTERS